jgi:uncharacterized protein with von Willebrand factor type A (vWA) domain
MNTQALPEIQVQNLTFHERALGKRVNVTVADDADAARRDIAGEAFFSLFKRSVELKENAPAGREVNHAVMQWVKDTPAFSETRSKTQGALPVAIAASQFLQEYLASEETLQAAMDAQAAANEARQEAQSAKFAQQAAEQAGDAEQAAKFAQKAAQAQVDVDAAMAEIGQEIEKMQGDPITRAAFHAAMKEASEKAEQVAATLRGFGNETGDESMTDVNAAQAALDTMSDKIREIAKLLGRFRGIAAQHRSDKTVTGFTPNGASYSRDITRMFDTEKTRLSRTNPLRDLALVEYATRGLLSWELETPAKEAGDFIALVDESGSMRGQPEINAKAAMLGLAQTARAENRRFKVGAFSTAAKPIREITDSANTNELMQWASKFQSGGTDFNYALSWAMDQLEASGSAHNSDVVILTDGYATIKKEVAARWAKVSEDTGARLYYIAIATSRIGDDPIAAIADVVVLVADLSDPTQLVEGVAQWIRP